MQDCITRLRGRFAIERPRAAQHLLRDRTEGEDVAARIGRLPAHLLRRHICGSPHHLARVGAQPIHAFGQFGDTEVEDLQSALHGDEQVLRLEVAVDDALGVGRSKPRGELQSQIQCLDGCERTARQCLAQCLPLEQFSDDVRLATVLADVVHNNDVWMIESAGRARLLLEPGSLLAVVRARLQRARSTRPMPPCPSSCSIA